MYLIMDPSSLSTVFGGGDRSGEVLNNLKASFITIFHKIQLCFGIIDTQVFSGFFVGILTVLLVSTIALVIKRRKEKAQVIKVLYGDYIISFCGIIGYSVVVSIITVYETPRYFYPVYAILLITVYCLLHKILSEIFVYERVVYLITILVFLVVTFFKFKENIHYLYRSTQEFLDAAAEYGNTDCIFVTEHRYDVNSSFYEIRNYHSVTFYSSYEPEQLMEADVETKEGLILTYTQNCGFEELDSYVRKAWPELKEAFVLGSHSGTQTVYYSR